MLSWFSGFKQEWRFLEKSRRARQAISIKAVGPSREYVVIVRNNIKLCLESHMEFLRWWFKAERHTDRGTWLGFWVSVSSFLVTEIELMFRIVEMWHCSESEDSFSESACKLVCVLLVVVKLIFLSCSMSGGGLALVGLSFPEGRFSME